MNITKFEEKVIEIVDNSNLFEYYKKRNCNPPYNRSRYCYYLHVNEIHKTIEFNLDCETPFNFSVSADTYDELFSRTFKVLKSYITSGSKTKEETSEEGKGE